jgi:hypothetical protein
MTRMPENKDAMELEEIAAETSKLPEEERPSLASQLLHGLETPGYSVSDVEVLSRVRRLMLIRQ